MYGYVLACISYIGIYLYVLYVMVYIGRYLYAFVCIVNMMSHYIVQCTY